MDLALTVHCCNKGITLLLHYTPILARNWPALQHLFWSSNRHPASTGTHITKLWPNCCTLICQAWTNSVCWKGCCKCMSGWYIHSYTCVLCKRSWELLECFCLSAGWPECLPWLDCQHREHNFFSRQHLGPKQCISWFVVQVPISTHRTYIPLLEGSGKSTLRNSICKVWTRTGSHWAIGNLTHWLSQVHDYQKRQCVHRSAWKLALM